MMRIRMSRPARFETALGGMLLVTTMIMSVGCLTPQVVSSGGSHGVAESLAKRDLGIDYLSSRRTAMAIRQLRASMELDPMDPQTHLWLGEAYRRKGKTAEAETFFLDAIKLSGSVDNAQTQQAARLSLSALLSQLGRYEESLEHCEALAADPTTATPWLPLTNCGWALFKLGRLDESRSHFQEALDFFPRFGPALLNLGILESTEGQKLKAIRIFESAIASERLGRSAIGEAHYRLGEIYIGLGRRDKAVTHFRASAEKAPNAEWGSQSQAYLDLLH
jgi:type IV pilus assembly protein PilF